MQQLRGDGLHPTALGQGAGPHVVRRAHPGRHAVGARAQGRRGQRQPGPGHRHGADVDRPRQRADRAVRAAVRRTPSGGARLGRVPRGDARRRRRGHRQALPRPGPHPQQHRLQQHRHHRRRDRRDDPYLEPFAPVSRRASGSSWSARRATAGSTPRCRRCSRSRSSPTCCAAGSGYDGVVITDDVNAQAVRGTPAPQRAVRFIEAGGDIVLTGARVERARRCTRRVEGEGGRRPRLRREGRGAVRRVVTLKERMGLLPCSTKP